MKRVKPSLLLCAAFFLTACGEGSATAGEQPKSTSITAVHAGNTTESSSEAVKTSDKDLNVLKTKLAQRLNQSGIEAPIKSIKSTELEGVYWVQASGAPAFFVDQSAQYIIQGEIVKLENDSVVDISAKLRRTAAKEALAGMSMQSTINFAPKGKAKTIVYAFTDVDCGYCRKLHAEIDQINKLGVEVRYLAWPRSEQSVKPMQAVWCAADPKEAMTKAKRGETVRSKSCNSPVEEQMKLGFELGVRGTPAIFTTSGEQIGGYLPARELAKRAIESAEQSN